ncbi:molybdenum cofactor guanylyltransferase MobA [Methylobacterium sp. Leaf466]|uniref:molybdenum cofactor guanylyltransferase MobA n=1 Tax=Methylobacterium sp. Leaf466 TaxID=1736386 RepID=UPI0006F942FB|nr:molybdenum cofactor guanylyltransferase MobA [Methylobacterium sp. Leaf466]KQT78984.1 molybdenum cofactor guanylyltransferase [Methylobacterium sp. Leaf466]
MPVLGVVLAGGLSRRMGGGDKPLLRLGGRSLLEHVCERFAPQCAAGVILNANGDPARFAGFAHPIVRDGVPGHPGPLAGILAALDHAVAHHPDVTHVASVTGDSPFLPRDLVGRFRAAIAGGTAAGGAANATVAVASSGGRQHFTTALWSVGLRDDLRAALVERDERRVGAYLARHGAVAVEWAATPLDPFLNVNTPEDLAAAQACLRAPG